MDINDQFRTDGFEDHVEHGEGETSEDCPMCQLEAHLAEQTLTFYVETWDGETRVVEHVVGANESRSLVSFHQHIDGTCHETVFVLDSLMGWSTLSA